MSRQPATGNFGRDRDISIEMRLAGVFTLTTEISDRGLKGALRYHVDCHLPEFTEDMQTTIHDFVLKHGLDAPSVARKSPSRMTVRMDGPPHGGSFAARYVHTASELFIALRHAYGIWNMETRLASAIFQKSDRATRDRAFRSEQRPAAV